MGDNHDLTLPDDLLDELGDWSQIKHRIIEKYGHAYTTILAQQALIRRALYIDAFAGTGFGIDRDTRQQLRGSAILAMETRPPFHELHFAEEDHAKSDVLRSATAIDPRVTVHEGNGIAVLESQLLDRCKYTDYRRALCLLDPYDLSVPWSLLERIGGMRSLEIFYTFMIMDANRNVLWRDPARVPEEQLARMEPRMG